MSHKSHHSGFSVEDIKKFRLPNRRSVKFATFWFLNQLIWSIFGHFMAIWSSKIEKSYTPRPSDPLNSSPLEKYVVPAGNFHSPLENFTDVFPRWLLISTYKKKRKKKGTRSPLGFCPGGASPLTFRGDGGKIVRSPLGFCPSGASPLTFRGVSGSLGRGVSFFEKKKKNSNSHFKHNIWHTFLVGNFVRVLP